MVLSNLRGEPTTDEAMELAMEKLIQQCMDVLQNQNTTQNIMSKAREKIQAKVNAHEQNIEAGAKVMDPKAKEEAIKSDENNEKQNTETTFRANCSRENCKSKVERTKCQNCTSGKCYCEEFPICKSCAKGLMEKWNVNEHMTPKQIFAQGTKEEPYCSESPKSQHSFINSVMKSAGVECPYATFEEVKEAEKKMMTYECIHCTQLNINNKTDICVCCSMTQAPIETSTTEDYNKLIADLMQDSGLSFDDATQIVRGK